ncbi:hypothetical protein BOX15_Mlig023931g4 [Macrostomum lignano]|uniref:ATP synthase F1 subunit epsilon n=1 Tax=Macrostomum lignano TaxID=282301 RepID=A0A267DVQ0_9PLAT|nr:hypothetical protein BOX15_Mlig023931g4 [Macrostomum lignano]
MSALQRRVPSQHCQLSLPARKVMSICRIARLLQLRPPVPAGAIFTASRRALSGDEWGRGAGKGGGAGGSIREAGGTFGKMEAAREEEYFRRLQNEQLSKLKEHLEDEVDHHENEIVRHLEAIQRHKSRMQDLSQKEQEGKKKDD